VDASETARIQELSMGIAREEAAVTQLRSQAADLEKQATTLQKAIDNAGTIVLTVGAKNHP
jgi:phage shock protein A